MTNIDTNNNSLPAWEVALLSAPVVEEVRPHRVEEWAITECSEDCMTSKIIYRWPADRPEARRMVEQEYDAKGYGPNPHMSFGRIVYWSDEPHLWESVGGVFF